MDPINRLHSFEATCSTLYSNSLGAEQDTQFDASEQQPMYRGMSVQVKDPIPIYNSQSVIHRNEANSFNPLNTRSRERSLSGSNYVVSECAPGGLDVSPDFALDVLDIFPGFASGDLEFLPDFALDVLDVFPGFASGDLDFLPDFASDEANVSSNFSPSELGVLLNQDNTVSGELMFTEPNSHNALHPLSWSSCGEASVNFSQPSSHPVVNIRSLNKDNQQEIQIEPANTVSINSGNAVKFLKRPLSECKDLETMPQKLAKAGTSTSSKNSFETADFQLIESSVSSESISLTSGDYYPKDYNDKRKEVVSSDIYVQDKAADNVYTQLRSKDSDKAFYDAFYNKLKELAPSSILDQAKVAGDEVGCAVACVETDARGRAAVQDSTADYPDHDLIYHTARNGYWHWSYKRGETRGYNDKLKELASSEMLDQAQAAGQAALEEKEKAIIEKTIHKKTAPTVRKQNISNNSYYKPIRDKVFNKTYGDMLKRCVPKEIFDQAKKTAKEAAQAAKAAAPAADDYRTYNRIYRQVLKSEQNRLTPDIVRYQATMAAKAAVQVAVQAEKNRLKASVASSSGELLPSSLAFQSLNFTVPIDPISP